MNKYRRLFIWVEGADDKRFIDRIIVPLLTKTHYDFVEVREYARLRISKLKNFIKSINAMEADYWFLADINTSPCISAKKSKLLEKFGFVDPTRLIIVIKEIESWYLAGLNEKGASIFKIKTFKCTDDIDKEKFLSFIPDQFDSKIDFLNELLKYFSLEIAKEKNQSFKYFLNVLLLDKNFN